jgi:hypothetical protein
MSASDIYQQMYGNAVSGAETSNNIPSGLLSALIGQESGWNPYAVGQNGEVGIAQLMPDTAQALGVDPWNTNENINGSAQYLSQQYSKFGNWRDALRAYNAGPSTAQNDPNAGAAYADKILSQFPSLTGAQNTQSTQSSAPANNNQFGLPSWAGSGFGTLLNDLLGNKSTNADGSANSSGISGLFSSMLINVLGLIVVVALVWYGIKSLLPSGTIVLSNAGKTNA